jgi:L-amino acid N-acyltransferase YncA
VTTTRSVAVIRPARSSDAEAIRDIYEPVVNGTFITFEEVAPATEEIVRRMRSRPRLPWLVAETADGVVGYACARQHKARPAYRWSAECSVYVAEAHRGHGVGRRLYERLVAEVRNLGYVSMFAGVALPNPASVSLHEGMGFRPVGVFPHVGYKLRAWHDVGWWILPLLPELPAEPPEPRAWGIEI